MSVQPGSVRAARTTQLFVLFTFCIIAQVTMGDFSNERDARIAKLQTWFHMSNADGPVNEEGIQLFLDEIKEVHFTDVNGDGRAASILQNGYSSVHDIAQMTSVELRETGFLAGQAKRVGMYLGSRPRDPSPARALPHGPISVAK